MIIARINLANAKYWLLNNLNKLLILIAAKYNICSIENLQQTPIQIYTSTHSFLFPLITPSLSYFLGGLSEEQTLMSYLELYSIAQHNTKWWMQEGSTF